jgi:hypothetical protein
VPLDPELPVISRTTTRDELGALQRAQDRNDWKADELREDLDEVRTFQRRALAGACSLIVAALAALGGGVSLLRESLTGAARRDERSLILEERVRRLENLADDQLSRRSP